MEAGTATQNADLVLEGGGVKGLALVGAVSVLEERGYRFHKVAGTSAGAIVGALVAARVPAKRLREIMEDLCYKDFRDPSRLGRLGFPGMLAEVLWHKGWCRGDYLRDWLTEKLRECEVETFKDLPLTDEHADAALVDSRDRAYRFVAMASDVTHGRLVRLPWHYREHFGLDPDNVPVVDAVRASMAIPFFYRPARILDGGGRCSWLVDGGILSNFPIDVFDRSDGEPPRWPTIGIKLSSRPTAARSRRVHGVVSLSVAMFHTMAGFHDRLSLARADVLARTIFVPADGIAATDFDISRETAEMLYQQGRDAATVFLDGDEHQPPWSFPDYLRRYRPQVAPAPADKSMADPAGVCLR